MDGACEEEGGDSLPPRAAASISSLSTTFPPIPFQAFMCESTVISFPPFFPPSPCLPLFLAATLLCTHSLPPSLEISISFLLLRPWGGTSRDAEFSVLAYSTHVHPPGAATLSECLEFKGQEAKAD